MLIVMYHIDHEFFNYLAPHLNDALQAFRLPMYYFISGIFFKLYSGYADFTRRKVNNILVPFVFFVVFAFAVRLLEYGFRLLVGAEPIEVRLTQLVEPFYLRYWENTTPLWFLLSLFWVNVIFYAMQRWIKPLVALPYFVLGWGVERIGAVAPTKWDRWGILALIAVAMPIYWLSDFMNLHFQVLPSYWQLYVLPFVAILALFWACKPLPHIPLFCYYGRYSLIILGTHPLILQPVRFLLLRQGMESGVELTLIVFVVTMLVELPLIWLLKTWAPRFTAQEPFFNPGWKLR